MKRLAVVLVLLGVFLLAFSNFVLSQEKAKSGQKSFKYIGTFRCKLCHNAPAKGKVYDWWAGEKHSKAYATLANEQSKNIAKGMGIADAQKSEKCLVCHVTGYNAPPEQKDVKYSMEEGITCEACHGPGEAYQAIKYMKDPALGMKEAGLIKPTNEVCIACHNKKSPTYKEFKFEVAVKQIKHGPPPAAPTK
jgi:nitrate/TMAO reductase-like tetraheme cytochrome c subunit